MRTRLLYGEPVEFVLLAVNARQEAPFLRISWREPDGTAYAELTNERGHDIPFNAQILGESQSIAGDYHVVRLWPRGPSGRGRYFRPGSYRLQVAIDAKKTARNPIRWVGQLKSNAIAFAILDVQADDRRALVSDALRKKAESLVRDLDAPAFRTREAAEQALTPLALDVLPLLEDVLGSRSREAASRAERIVWKAVGPLIEKSHPSILHQGIWREGGPLLATFGEPTWNVVRTHVARDTLIKLRLQAALYGPVDPYRDLDRLSAAEIRQIAARLADSDPVVRILAIRSLSKTANQELLKALIERLSDPYFYYAGMVDPARYHVVAAQAREAILYQGDAAIGPLIAFARARQAQAYRGQIIQLLGELGSDRRTFQFLSETLASPSYSERYETTLALTKLGSAAVPMLLGAAQDPKEHENIRREAIRGLGEHGDAKLLGSFLLRMLRHENPQLVGAAAEAAGRLRLHDALTDLTRIARNEGINQNARYRALCAVLQIAERKEAERLLMDLLDKKCHAGTRGVAMAMLAQLDSREAIPTILDALDEKDWFVRTSADRALRAFADRPAGVDYDADHPEPAKWRAYWKPNP